MKQQEEWFLETIGLKIAMVRWGSLRRPGALLVHGHGDSAATFARLVPLLPDDFCYVSFDFPGHGKSSFIPLGPLPTHGLLLEVMRQVVMHLQWNSFICIGHSMGAVLAMLHDHLHPGQISRLICLDPLYGLMRYVGVADHHSKYVSPMFYDQYYDAVYHIFSNPKTSTYDDALSSVMRQRKLDRELAELILQRTLTPLDDDLYSVSPQKTVFGLAHLPATFDIVEHIFKNVDIPLLIFHTSESLAKYSLVKFTSDVTRLFDNKSTKYRVICLDGVHDQQLVRPEDFVTDIAEFLGCKCKI